MPSNDLPAFAVNAATALLRGVYEVALTVDEGTASPTHDFTVTFSRAGRATAVAGFFDGGTSFKARAYLDTPGEWTWHSHSSLADLDDRRGRFLVEASSDLPGKLRVHPDDPYQFAFDNGQWYLHVGDTGYRYVHPTEPHWRAYVDQAVRAGFTKIRTWFGTPGNGSNGDIGYLFAAGGLHLADLQTADERILYALAKYPHLQIQLIPFGEDSARLLLYAGGDALTHAFARQVQSRFSALPNVQWTLSNDRGLTNNEPLRCAIDRLGHDWVTAEPWGTLITNHQARYEAYSFSGAPWSSVVTFEDADQVSGERILHYRSAGVGCPIVNDEDRYESWISPANSRYFFRRLMWASLLSGGHATYGGGATWLPYAPGTNAGVQGYFDLNQSGLLAGGAGDFNHLHRFFEDTSLTLVGFEPCDALFGGDGFHCRASRRDDAVIIYLPNPSSDLPQTDGPSQEPPTLRVPAALDVRDWDLRWFNPREGVWYNECRLSAGQLLRAPGAADWIALLQRRQ